MLNIKVNELKATTFCAATKGIRYYLNGVCLQIRGEQGYLISTDGSCLFAGKMTMEWQDVPQKGPWDMIIPLKTIKAALKGAKGTVALVALPDGRYSLGGVIFAPVDGKFPDWQRVIPRTLGGEAPKAVDFELMTRAAKALHEWFDHGRRILAPCVQYSGPNSALLLTMDDDRACAVVMPIKAYYAPLAPFEVQS